MDRQSTTGLDDNGCACFEIVAPNLVVFSAGKHAFAFSEAALCKGYRGNANFDGRLPVPPPLPDLISKKLRFNAWSSSCPATESICKLSPGLVCICFVQRNARIAENSVFQRNLHAFCASAWSLTLPRGAPSVFLAAGHNLPIEPARAFSESTPFAVVRPVLLESVCDD